MGAQHRIQGWHGNLVRDARAYWGGQLPLPCALCGLAVEPGTRWVVEHRVPLSKGGTVGRSNQGVSHRSCSDRQAGELTSRLRGRRLRDWL